MHFIIESRERCFNNLLFYSGGVFLVHTIYYTHPTHSSQTFGNQLNMVLNKVLLQFLYHHHIICTKLTHKYNFLFITIKFLTMGQQDDYPYCNILMIYIVCQHHILQFHLLNKTTIQR